MRKHHRISLLEAISSVSFVRLHKPSKSENERSATQLDQATHCTVIRATDSK